MDITDLETFMAVSELGSFSKAAEQIHLTQPAISKRIATLEAEIGARLFDRIGRKVTQTEAGRTLASRTHSILLAIADVKTSINNLDGTVSGPLHIATSHHIGLHRLPAALRHLNQNHPEVMLDLKFMDSEQACHEVTQGNIELAVVTLPQSADKNLHQQPVWHDPLRIVVAPDHELAFNKQATIEKLLTYPAILPGPSTVTREIILKKFGRYQKQINVAIATNYLEVLKMLTVVGLGWSALPETMIDESLIVVQIKDMNIKRELGIVWHKQRTLSNAAKLLIDIISKHEI
jgi:DNA-binding transcriptional LysR family regulator